MAKRVVERRRSKVVGRSTFDVRRSTFDHAPSSAPIGVFDSGMGGFSVARPLLSRLPNEAMLYVGDTARLPYGPRPVEEVRRFSLAICDFLIGQRAKLIIIA